MVHKISYWNHEQNRQSIVSQANALLHESYAKTRFFFFFFLENKISSTLILIYFNNGVLLTWETTSTSKIQCCYNLVHWTWTLVSYIIFFISRRWRLLDLQTLKNVFVQLWIIIQTIFVLNTWTWTVKSISKYLQSWRTVCKVFCIIWVACR